MSVVRPASPDDYSGRKLVRAISDRDGRSMSEKGHPLSSVPMTKMIGTYLINICSSQLGMRQSGDLGVSAELTMRSGAAYQESGSYQALVSFITVAYPAESMRSVHMRAPWNR